MAVLSYLAALAFYFSISVADSEARFKFFLRKTLTRDLNLSIHFWFNPSGLNLAGEQKRGIFKVLPQERLGSWVSLHSGHFEGNTLRFSQILVKKYFFKKRPKC